jgi:murein DD-endopeptidase MepM/ murein hydrolase activator NlpD
LSQAAYRGRHRPPAGRHRASRSPRSSSTSSLPRFAGSGYLLPTAAAATLVLTATGAHIGSSAGTPTAGAAPTTSITASGLLAEDPIERGDSDRAARDTTRTSANSGLGGTDALAAAEAGRADQEEAADTAERAQAQADATAAAAAAAAKAAADAQAATAAAAQAQADAAAQQQAQAAAVAASGHSWVPFIDGGYQLTSGFGMRWGSMHPGQDFAVPVGTPVKAMSSGTVIFAGWQGGYGNKVEIQYWDGTVSWFCHNSKLMVSQGEKVTPGELVSMSGNTGHSTGPHIHVEIHPQDGSPISPLPWLKKMGTMP